MNCEGCGAPMRVEPDLESLVCDYCGSVRPLEKDAGDIAVVGDETKQLCPLCRVSLVAAIVARRAVLSCRHCQGVLIPMDDFIAVVDELRSQGPPRQSAGPAPDPRELDRVIECPQCGAPMDTHRYGGAGNVIIDSCEDCSVNWLDGGELERIAHAPDHGPAEAWKPPRGNSGEFPDYMVAAERDPL
jgi:Zn-finger nucleic acid-binding protein